MLSLHIEFYSLNSSFSVKYVINHFLLSRI
nr:MAG TPA: hypothetical protein [Caudoviricetes sp.]